MRPRLPAALLATLLATGCSATKPWVSPDEHQRLVRQLLELERRAATAELEIERLKRRLAEVESGGAAAATPRANVAPIREAAEAPPTVWREPRATIEESELAEIDRSTGGAEAGATGYERGLALLRDGRAADAETALRGFLDSGASADLADNAWFWIGESLLVRGETTGAIAAYRSCLEQYPEGNKAPDAMLKLGHALALVGDDAAAREVWSELVRRFPATAAAETAASRLGAP